MTLKEELEILRGEPIQVFTGDPMDIPCIETSDPEKLCKNPVVSVHMITYNHEPYIRQAIEGVMMQKTDFEFELIIGEDCSTDKTREICFEYQKKYPDKIRVLWWHENLYRNPHPAGGNARRVTAHCRGEFIAFCEGDDYWVDHLKLQKQVDVMRQNDSVGLCFCGAKILWVGCERVEKWNATGEDWAPGLIPGKKFFLTHIFGADPVGGHTLATSMLMTASVMVRKKVLLSAYELFAEVYSYRMRLGDTTTWLGVSACSDAYYLADEVSVYRQVATGACNTMGHKVCIDASLVRLYFANVVWGLTLREAPSRFVDNLICSIAKNIISCNARTKICMLRDIIQSFTWVFLRARYLIVLVSAFVFGSLIDFDKFQTRVLRYMMPLNRVKRQILRLYRQN